MARRPWLERLPLGDSARRVLEDTLADGHRDRAAASTTAARWSASVVTVSAVVRGLVSLLGVLQEGYPMRNLGRDVAYAVRRLRSAPAFTIFSVMALAIGIGATTAIVSVVRTVTGPPLGISQPQDVVDVFHSRGFNHVNNLISWADFKDYRATQTSLSLVTAWSFSLDSILANGHSESAFVEEVDANYFAVLGVGATIGRTLQNRDDDRDSPPVAVISDILWRRDFDASPDVIGRTLVVNGVALPIVGVASAPFQGLFNGGLVPSALWLSMPAAKATAAPGTLTGAFDLDRGNRWLSVVGRLNPGHSVAQAQAEAGVIAGRLDAAYPLGQDLDPQARRRFPTDVSRQWTVRRLSDVGKIGGVGQDQIAIFVAAVLIASGLVLLVACTNLANLTLARGTARAHEVAVRVSLGATRWRLIREALVESVCVISLGGIAGLAVAASAVAFFRNDIAMGPAVIHLPLAIDRASFLAALSASLLALVVAGLVPALFSTRADVRTALMTDGHGGALPRWRGRRWLIAMQVGVSLAFYLFAAISIDQVRRELEHDTGLSLDRFAVANIDFAGQHVDETRARQLAESIVDRLGREPGVTTAAATSGLPFGVSNPGTAVTTLDRPIVPDKYYGSFAGLVATTPHGLQAIGVRVLKGRGFTERDDEAAQSVAILSRSAARRLFDTDDVVGREVQVQTRRWVGMLTPPVVTRTVVGVASDTEGPGGREADLTVYVPLRQQPWGRLTIVARTDGEAAAMVPALRRSIAAAAPSLVTADIGTAMSVTGASDVALQIFAGVAGLVGSFALTLALAGLYGVLSHVVARRVREIGVRRALGATERQIMRLILGDGIRPVVLGVVLGLVAGVLARMGLRPLFVRGGPVIDPLAVAAGPVAILLAGWLACYLPARRASRVDPNAALREL